MSEQGPADDGVENAADDAAEDFSMPMWVWTVLAFVLLMAAVIVVIIRGGAKQDPGTTGAPDAGGATLTQPATQPIEEPVTQPG